jgi:hypothetical protein
MALDPTGTFAYAGACRRSYFGVRNQLGHWCAQGDYRFTPSREEIWEWRQWTRVVTTLPGSPLAAGNDPLFVTVDANDKFVYVVNYNGKNVSGYTINPATATHTITATVKVGRDPINVALPPDGAKAYVVNAAIF